MLSGRSGRCYDRAVPDVVAMHPGIRTRRGAILLSVVTAIVVALAVGMLLVAPSAQAGSDITVVLKNDLNNRTSGGYPKVALDRLADRD